MTTAEYGSDVNLEDLRSQLTGHLAVILVASSYVAGMLLMAPVLAGVAYPLTELGLMVALLGLGLAARLLANFWPTLARHLLAWGLTAGLLAGMWLFSAPWLPYLGLVLAFVNSMLISGGGLVATGAIAVLAVWLVRTGNRTYPLTELVVAFALGAAVAWLVARTFYTALGWAWTMQERADHLLKLARDRQGELANALKSLDINNALLRRTQRELIGARKQEEEARLMKERFAANVSHELRTPLNLILGFSELMYHLPEVYGDVEWPPKLRRAVYQIYRSSRHLLEMIDDVLDLSHFEMVGFALNKEAVPLEPLLRETVEIAEDLFRERPIRLEVEIAPDLPVLTIDRTRIRQVLLNLLNNAARFTEEGTVRVEAKRGDGEVMVSVSDTGPGVPADKQSRIFDEFYQVDQSLHRKVGGAGLGLAISKRFVEAHDGRIWVESPATSPAIGPRQAQPGSPEQRLRTGEEGVGSTFTFTLPIPEEHVPFSRLKIDRPLEPSWSQTRPPILVVDPDPTVANLIDRHIGEYEVVQVGDVDRLAEEIRLHHPQAVVWNVLPGEQVDREDIPVVSVPFIECSLPSQAWVADDLAVAVCLTKPVTAEQLVQVLERVGNVHDVLVIDDERGFCQLVEVMLESSGHGFEVRYAYDGEEGLRALRARRPDVVLLDLVMPGMDGFQVLEEMRRDSQLADVPVVVVTATSYAEDALAQRSGQMVIHRPDGLSPVEVLRCLRAVIGVLEPRYDERAAPEESLVVRET